MRTISRLVTIRMALWLTMLASLGCGADSGPNHEPASDAQDATETARPMADLEVGNPDTQLADRFETGPQPDIGEPDEVMPDTGSHPDSSLPADWVIPCRVAGPCDDGQACTFDDRCDADGLCRGTAYQCSDGRACTEDLCDGLGDCTFAVKDEQCLIHDICAAAGTVSPHNACLFCDPQQDRYEWQPASDLPCEDGDPCTVGDRCESGACHAGSDPFICDDGDPCTDEVCVPGQGCVSTDNQAPCDDGSPCTVGDQCLLGTCSGFPGGCDDGNPCTLDYCEGGLNCTHSPRPGPCDDGNACTLNDACSAGQCAGGLEQLDCDDGNLCTYDVCDPLGGCLHASNSVYCNDSDPCTFGDRCIEGDCVPGGPLNCDDANECTNDACDPERGCVYVLNDNPCCENGHNICSDGDPCTSDLCDLQSGGCTYVFNTAACDDDDACTADDACLLGQCHGTARDCDDGNSCTSDRCDVAQGCVHQPLSGACNDNNACTVNDVCQFGVCIGNHLNCSDTNLCTTDTCDPAVGCQNTFNSDPCDDGDVCTIDDRCQSGSCHGQPDLCDDQNSCTTDHCQPFIGCQHQTLQNGSPCNDGRECTVGEQCQGGACLGDMSNCTCDPLAGPASKMTFLNLGLNGQTGEGLDVDADATTCFPPENCCCGIDNSMSKFAALANSQIDNAILGGSLTFLIQYTPTAYGDGQTFSLVPWPAHLANEGCDHMTAVCDYTVDGGGFDSNCQALVTLPNARIVGNQLTAGGVGYNFPFNLPLFEGMELQITLYNAMIQGTVTLSGGEPTSVQGILAGAVPKQQILDAIQAIPDSELPLPKNVIIQMVTTMVRDDIDTDGDLLPDAASIGLKFSGILGHVVGVD